MTTPEASRRIMQKASALAYEATQADKLADACLRAGELAAFVRACGYRDSLRTAAGRLTEMLPIYLL